MKSTAARRSARPTLGATRPWITAGCATAQWKARFARRYPPPLEPPPNPCLLDRSLRSNHHRIDPRKQTPGGRHQIGTPAGFKSESVAGFLLECVAGFVGIRKQMPDGPRWGGLPLPTILSNSSMGSTLGGYWRDAPNTLHGASLPRHRCVNWTRTIDRVAGGNLPRSKPVLTGKKGLTKPANVPLSFSWKTRHWALREALAGRCTCGAPMAIAKARVRPAMRLS